MPKPLIIAMLAVAACGDTQPALAPPPPPVAAATTAPAVLLATAPVGPLSDAAEAIRAKCTGSPDPYRGVTEVVGPTVSQGMDGAGVSWGLVTTIMGAERSDTMLVSRFGKEVQGWAAAADSGGNQLAIETVYSGHRDGGYVIEVFALQFPENYLFARRDAGLDIQVWSTTNRQVMTLPPEYLQGFLTAVATPEVLARPED